MNLNRIKKFAKILIPALEFRMRETAIDLNRVAVIQLHLEKITGVNNEYVLNYSLIWDGGNGAAPVIRTQEIANEIMRVFPNVTVIEQIVFSFEGCVSFIVKQLGDKGTYTINIYWKKN